MPTHSDYPLLDIRDAHRACDETLWTIERVKEEARIVAVQTKKGLCSGKITTRYADFAVVTFLMGTVAIYQQYTWTQILEALNTKTTLYYSGIIDGTGATNA